MIEKRFTETVSTGIIEDSLTGKEYKCEYRVDDDFLELVNTIANENEQLKHDASILVLSNQDYRKENEQLKQELKSLNKKYIAFSEATDKRLKELYGDME